MSPRMGAALAATALFLSGCGVTTDVANFYTPVPHRDVPPPSVQYQPELLRSSGDAKRDIAEQVESSYEVIGYSEFNGKEAGKWQATLQAKKVGATRVIYGAKFTGSEYGGSVGSTSFGRYSATSFSIPINVRRYDQIVIFLQKAPRRGFGFQVALLSPAEQQDLGSNKGVRIVATVRGSPAFNADILPGDIVLSINGRPLYDADSAKAAAEAAYGTNATVLLSRRGTSVEKHVLLSTSGEW